jgi:hypothetical protein
MPSNGGTYPKAVVVITDGEATFNGNQTPSKENTKNWRWLICKNMYGFSSSNSYIRGLQEIFGKERILNLDDFIG